MDLNTFCFISNIQVFHITASNLLRTYFDFRLKAVKRNEKLRNQIEFI